MNWKGSILRLFDRVRSAGRGVRLWRAGPTLHAVGGERLCANVACRPEHRWVWEVPCTPAWTRCGPPTTLFQTLFRNLPCIQWAW